MMFVRFIKYKKLMNFFLRRSLFSGASCIFLRLFLLFSLDSFLPFFVLVQSCYIAIFNAFVLHPERRCIRFQYASLISSFSLSILLSFSLVLFRFAFIFYLFLFLISLLHTSICEYIFLFFASQKKRYLLRFIFMSFCIIIININIRPVVNFYLL